jgi:hypothetical protein
MKEVGEFPYRDDADVSTHRLSPDGRYLLAGGKKSTIPLPDGRVITVLPLLQSLHSDVADVAWSGDCGMVYILNKSRPQKLVIHNLKTGKQSIVKLRFSKPDYFGMWILVHPGTGKIYIRTGISFDQEIEIIQYLFMLDPAKIPKNKKVVTAEPQLLGNMFASVALGPNDTLLFGLMPDKEASEPAFPAEYEGIFMADLDGKVMRRITKNHYELYLQYMTERRLLIVTRQKDIYNVGLVNQRAIYRKKSNLPSTPITTPR